MADLRAQYGDEVIDQIQEFIHRNDPPLVEQLRDDRELLREYWEIEDDMVSQFPEEVQQRFEFYREHQRQARPSIPGQWRDVQPIVEMITKMRQMYRASNSKVDETLAKWGYRATPMNPDIRLKYADVRWLPAERGGSLAPVATPTATPAQPARIPPARIQATPQPSRGAPSLADLLAR